MAQETLRENKMGTMPENKLLLSMAVPMMISMLVQALRSSPCGCRCCRGS